MDNPLPIPAASFVAVMVASLATLAWLYSRFRERDGDGAGPVSFEPRRLVPWSGLDVLLVVGLLLVVQIAMRSLILTKDDVDALQPPTPAASLHSGAGVDVQSRDMQPFIKAQLAFAAASLLAMALAMVYLKKRRGATWRDLGLGFHAVGGDTLRGVVAFFAVFAPVLGLKVVITLAFPDQKEHPVIEFIIKNPQLAVLIVATVSTVVVAPLAEEFFFRAVLQGWLDSWAMQATPEAVVGDGPQSVSSTHGRVFSTRMITYAPLLAAPILLSSTFFAAVHFSADWRTVPPLFILALALGYLYQRTHRLTPCIVLHVCLNGFTMSILWMAAEW